jgi:APA family basic amino acid/polyamine antiporter
MSPRESIGLRAAVALIVGIVIGAGIFKAPTMVAGMTGSTTWMFAAWLLGGVMSLIGALCYAELATAYPHAGGDYHFLHRAYGRSVAFLFAWARFTIVNTGSIALLGFVFGDYLSQVFPFPSGGAAGPAIYAGIAILVLSWVNLRGVAAGTSTQTWLTVIEVAGLLLIVAAAIALPVSAPVPSPDASAAAPPSAPSLGAFGMAMVFVLLTYGGWNEAAFISAELRNRRKNMVRALVLSITIITALYLLVTWAYWKGLGIAGMAKSDALAADLLGLAFGPIGSYMISIMVAVAALTSINATMIVGARTGYAVGGDWPVLAKLGVWDGVRGTPANALRIQCVAALLLVAVGTWTGGGFKSMVEFTAPVFWLFFLLSGLSVFVLRRKEPDTERPFRVPLYPLLPLLFCAMSGYMLWSSLSYVRSQSLGGLNAAWIGVAVLGAGCIALLLLRALPSRRPRPSTRASSVVRSTSPTPPDSSIP